MEKFVRSGELPIWAERRGDPGDPAVLLVMGTSAPAIGWPEGLVAALVAGGRQVLRFDHRDTGRSGTVDFTAHPYTVADMAGDALAVLDGFEVASAHVVGASLGGTIAQYLAVEHPGRVRALTVIMSSPLGADLDALPPPTPAFLQHIAARSRTPRTTRAERIAEAVATWRVLNGGELPFEEESVRRFVTETYDRARDIDAAEHHSLAARPDADPSRITAPTQVLHGSADPLLPPEHGRAVAAAIPGAHFHLIPGMGHSFYAPGLPEKIAGLILAG